MCVVKNNWIICEIDNEEYTILKHKFPNIGNPDYYPRQYYLIKEKYTNESFLLEQTDIGLHEIPYITFTDRKQSIICLTDCCYVIDYGNQKIVSQIELNTCCVDLLFVDQTVYVICETEIIKYYPYTCTWGESYDLSDSIEHIIQNNKCLTVILYDGSSHTIPL